MKQRQEIHCHDCNKWVQFEIDLEMDGNHVLECPNCGHEHCRVVKKGEITDIRWDQRNGPTFRIVYSSVSTAPVYLVKSAYTTSTNTTTATAYFTTDMWMCAGTGS